MRGSEIRHISDWGGGVGYGGMRYRFTVNLLERKKSLLVDNIDLLRESVRCCKQQHLFHIDTLEGTSAWVVLPELDI